MSTNDATIDWRDNVSPEFLRGIEESIAWARRRPEGEWAPEVMTGAFCADFVNLMLGLVQNGDEELLFVEEGIVREENADAAISLIADRLGQLAQMDWEESLSVLVHGLCVVAADDGAERDLASRVRHEAYVVTLHNGGPPTVARLTAGPLGGGLTDPSRCA